VNLNSTRMQMFCLEYCPLDDHKALVPPWRFQPGEMCLSVGLVEPSQITNANLDRVKLSFVCGDFRNFDELGIRAKLAN
jgi:hypothetical protein